MNIEPINAPAVPEGFHLKLRKRFYNALMEEMSKKDAEFNSSICLFKGIQTIPKNYEDVDHVV